MGPPEEEMGSDSDDQHWRNGAAGAKSFLYNDLVFVIKKSYNVIL